MNSSAYDTYTKRVLKKGQSPGDLPPSMLGKKKKAGQDGVLPWEVESNTTKPSTDTKPIQYVNSQFTGESEQATNRRHAASVELADAQMGSLKSRSNSISSRKATSVGRGYYHPDRIRERAIKRNEQWQQQTVARRGAMR